MYGTESLYMYICVGKLRNCDIESAFLKLQIASADCGKNCSYQEKCLQK